MYWNPLRTMRKDIIENVFSVVFPSFSVLNLVHNVLLLQFIVNTHSYMKTGKSLDFYLMSLLEMLFILNNILVVSIVL